MVITSGMVFDIQKFSIHDGPGIRTTVFMKGCPLRCLWCHNPESFDGGAEISLVPAKCIGCGHCFMVCPRHCHSRTGASRDYNRSVCIRCGLCADQCYARAIELIGRKMTVDDVLAEVEKDRPFYETSGGGMTLSGGEPMFQFEFTLALLAAARRRKLHTCIETAGFAAVDRFAQLLPLVDLFLYDYKETDPVRHEEYTGVPRDTLMRKCLFACDELCGFLVACALVTPTKSPADVKVESVKKKMKDKSFARQVHREEIIQGACELEVDLDEHIAFVRDALVGIAGDLGLG